MLKPLQQAQNIVEMSDVEYVQANLKVKCVYTSI